MIAEDVAAPRRRVSVRGGTWVLAAVTFVGYTATSSYAYAYSLFDSGYDLSIFDQAVRHYARFEAPVSMALAQDANTLGEHFSPILALLAPLYWIWADPHVLFAAQAALIAVSVVVVVRFARRHVSDRVALLIGAGYAFGWPVQGLTSFDFHEIAFAVPLLALTIDALDRRDDRALLLWGLALLTVREDMGLILVTVGLVRLLRRDRRWFGLVLVAVGLVGYVVVTSVVIPALSSTGSWKFWSYDALGPDLPSSLRTIVTEPVTAARLFVTPDAKLQTLVLLLLPVLFVALRSPYVLIAVPLLAARFWSSRENLWQPYFHYNVVVWVVIVLAAIHAISLFSAGLRPAMSRGVAGAAVVCVVLGTPVATNVFQTGVVLRDLVQRPARVQEAVDQRERLLAEVPAGTCLVGDSSVIAHALTTNVVGVPGRWTRPADFQLLARDPGTNPQESVQQIADARAAGYVEIASTSDHLLFRSPDYTGPTDACRP